MTTSAIKFTNVTKTFVNSDKKAVNNLSFEVVEGEFVTVLGSSGSGKTTTMKMINRLLDPEEGEIEFYGKNILEIDKVELRKQIGYVVQQIGLFPHMTVAENISIVPELFHWKKEDTHQRVNELLKLMQLPPEEFSHRKPRELSGGQQQRVGVARALAGDPKVMLLDEPFGAIDAITRLDLQAEILRIHQTLSDKTFVLVTHDINEAFKLGTKVLIMDQGEICQFDTPKNILNNPKTAFVKNLIATVKEQEKFWSDLA